MGGLVISYQLRSTWGKYCGLLVAKIGIRRVGGWQRPSWILRPPRRSEAGKQGRFGHPNHPAAPNMTLTTERHIALIASHAGRKRTIQGKSGNAPGGSPGPRSPPNPPVPESTAPTPLPAAGLPPKSCAPISGAWGGRDPPAAGVLCVRCRSSAARCGPPAL